MPARNRAVWIPEQLRIVVGMQVDEAGHYQQPAGIDDLFTLVRFQMADFGDLSIFDTDVSLITRQPSAVDNNSTPNDGIEFRHFSYPLRSLRFC